MPPVVVGAVWAAGVLIILVVIIIVMVTRLADDNGLEAAEAKIRSSESGRFAVRRGVLLNRDAGINKRQYSGTLDTPDFGGVDAIYRHEHTDAVTALVKAVPIFEDGFDFG